MRRFFYTCLLLFASFILVPQVVQAQFLKKTETSKVPERGLVLQVGGGIGAARSTICSGWGCNRIGPAVSMGALYKLSSQWGIGATVGYVRLGASESAPEHPLNVSFQTDVLEVSGKIQFNLLDSYVGSGNYRSSRKRFMVPYLTAGIGLISYTATSFPGQGKLNTAQTTYAPARDYPAVAAVMPLGGGVRLRFTDELSLTPEFLYYLTNTDYLDNMAGSASGSKQRDGYGVVLLRFLYTPAVANRIFSQKEASH
ncbi:thrombospondin type 3 repeat-containing protein [Pontibacter chitinilyticus]|uniref:thrombospondin type 3 repeat-containing protein n=1 Tax=Pontibacter chitinilyticus TaxID=2674989 RepID=UPI00321C129C